MLFNGREHFLKALADLCPNTKVIYDKNNIFVINVNSFKDCNRIFARDTIHWCIANHECHWNEYVGGLGQKQFFIIDFNKINDIKDREEYNYSLIGFTLKNNKLYAAHARNDDNLLTGSGLFSQILKKKDLYNFIVKQKMEENNGENTDNGLIKVSVVVVIIILLMTLLAIFH